MTEYEMEVFKRQIEIQIEEYSDAVSAAQAWWNGWKERISGFRCKRAEGQTNDQTESRNDVRDRDRHELAVCDRGGIGGHSHGKTPRAV